MNKLFSGVFFFLFLFQQVLCGFDLTSYQVASGGFKNQLTDTTGSLRATEDALFLAVLYGQVSEVRPTEIPKYLRHLQNHDFGWGKQSGLASDIDSLRSAVYSYSYIGQHPEEVESVVSFVESLYDPKTKLFAPRSGETGDLESSLHALQVLSALGVRDAHLPKYAEGINNFIGSHAVLSSDAPYYSFPEYPHLNDVEANHYALRLGSLSGLEFPAYRKLAGFVLSRQVKVPGNNFGGFHPSNSDQADLATTYHAVQSLHLLSNLNSNHDILSLLDGEGARQYVLSQDLTQLSNAAKAHLVIALSGALAKSFHGSITYDVLGGGTVTDRIVQGWLLKPSLVVRVAATHSIHTGLHVTLHATTPGGKSSSPTRLEVETGRYVATRAVDTSYLLGRSEFQFVATYPVPNLGNLTLTFSDVKSIGYAVDLHTRAVLDITGKEVTDEEVTIGTVFEFKLSLHNKTNPHFISGNFNITFNVRDSSGILIHHQESNYADNHEELFFTYTLKDTNIPPGILTFSFKIKDNTTNYVHTSVQHTYRLAIPLVASDITFLNLAADQAPTFKLGETVTVSIGVGTLPDMRTVFPISAADIHGKDVSKSRRFFLDIHTPSGVTVRTVEGVPFFDSNRLRYKFSLVVENTFASIGTLFLSFRYSPLVETDQFKLLNYDSKFSELYDDNFGLNYTVIANLELTDVTASPSENDFYYGNEVEYRFNVKDAITSTYVLPDPVLPSSTVYLVLSHLDEFRGRQFTSAQIPAKLTGNEYTIRWEVSANAVHGPGRLTLLALDADSNPLTVHSTDPHGIRAAASKAITVGGDIEVGAKTRSETSHFLSDTPFIVDFNLTCRNKTLKNAQLQARVYYMTGSESEQKELIGAVPVARTSDGRYSVSWAHPHRLVRSGRYLVLFSRLADTSATTAKWNTENNEDPSNIKELFKVIIDHEVGSLSSLPVRTEFIVLLLLILAFAAISYGRVFKLK